MNAERRIFLQATAGQAALLALLGTGLLRSTRVLAVDARPGFAAANIQDALRAISASNATESRDIVVKLPDIADNAANVPIDITSNIPNTESISVLVDKNPHPLVARVNFANGALPQLHLRFKMAQTSNVRVVVKAADKTWHIIREVKVTLGGCGA